MENLELIKREFFGEIQEHIVITREDGSQLSMSKQDYDEQQKAAELGGTL